MIRCHNLWLMPPGMASKQPGYGQRRNTHSRQEYLNRISSFSQLGHDYGHPPLNKFEPRSQPDIPQINEDLTLVEGTREGKNIRNIYSESGWSCTQTFCMEDQNIIARPPLCYFCPCN